MMKADVYRNLHKGLMSIRSRETHNYGRVAAHSNYIRMRDCVFVVNERGRQKVIETKRKNVHAFIRGTITRAMGYHVDTKQIPTPSTQGVDAYTEVTYNPYSCDKFVTKNGNVPVGGAEEVLILNNKVYAKKIWCI